MPWRGVPCSAAAHGVALWALLLLRQPPVLVDLRTTATKLQALDVSLLPELKPDGSEGSGSKAKDEAEASESYSQSNIRSQTYYGIQHIVSTPEDPDNTVQTILQPDIQAPKIAVPIPVPNMVKIAMPRAVELPILPKTTSVSMAVPVGTVQAQDVSTNTMLAAAPTPVMQTIPAREAPKLPVPDHDAVAPEPVKAKAPSPQAETPKPSGAPPAPPKTPQPKSDVKPIEPAQQVAKPVEGTGHDEHNLLVINALNQPNQPPKEMPKGELHGAFEVVTTAAAHDPTKAPGPSNAKVAKANEAADDAKENPNGLTKKLDHSNGVGESGHGKSNTQGGSASLANNGTGAGERQTATGNGAGSGNQSGVFPFVTVEAAKSSAEPPKAAPRESYGMTIVGGTGSGGGLRDYGVFRDGTSYTNYIDMSSLGASGARWILQYGISTSERAMHTTSVFAPPYALQKQLPSLPSQVVSNNIGKMIVVQGEIDTDGKLGGMRILQTPDTNAGVVIMQSLAQWRFQPAAIGSDAVRVKVLLGIPISRAMMSTVAAAN